MRNLTITSILIIFTFLTAKAQNDERDGKLVTDGAYAKKISKDLNYLILGESSPQQGIGFTLNEDGSNLKINGLLIQKERFLWTLEGDFSSTDGIYFFDKEGGGKKAKIGLNAFWEIKIPKFTGSKYIGEEEEVYNAKILKIERVLKEYAGKFNALNSILNQSYPKVDNGKVTKNLVKTLPTNTSNYDKAKKMLVSLFTKHSIGIYNKDDSYDFDLKDYKTKAIKFQKVYIKDEQSETIAISYKLDKVYEDYIKVSDHIRNKLKDELYSIEDTITKDQWSRHKIFFIGFNLAYERESFRRFTFDESLAFEKMFNDERGNRLGAEVSLNWLYNAESNYSLIKPDNFFIKSTFGLRRASNISTFTNTTLNSGMVIGTDSNGMEITQNSTDGAFIGSDTYQTGLGASIALDLYYFPYKKFPIGAFLEIKHEYINFKDDTGVKDIQLSPFRAGLLYNFKNTEKDKPLATFSFFMDRTDLSKDPSGNDNDLRFGIGIGLPINLK